MTMYSGGDPAPAGASRRPRPLSPEQIRNAELARAGLGRRGYNEHEVDLLLSRIAADAEGWIAENRELRAELHRLKDVIREWRGETQPEPAVPNPEAVALLSRAQQEAESLVAQAQAYARDVAEHARQQYEETLRAAHNRAAAAAQEAAQTYRQQASGQYATELEELERKVAWMRAFARAVQVQLQAVSEAFAREVERIAAGG